MDIPELFIVTINNHPVLGPLLVPYYAREEDEDVLRVLDNATTDEKAKAKGSKAVRQIISYAQSYTERKLMRLYSKERIVTEFLRKLDGKTFTDIIRPYIDKKHREIIALMQEEGVPLYIRDTGVDLLYSHYRIDISQSYIEVRYRCEADDDYFRYALQWFQDGRRVQLQKVRPYFVLSSDPALLVIGSKLLVFDQIRVGRISPFLDKKYVEVPASETRKYLEKIVIPLMSQHVVEASGFNITERRMEKIAGLEIEATITGLPGLRLSFHYGKREFYPNEKPKLAYPWLVEEDGRLHIDYFKRDIGWESRCIAFLTGKGFKQIGDNGFSHKDILSDFMMVDWLNGHKEEVLSLFSYKTNDSVDNYFIGDIRITQEVDDKQDWFEVRITVWIGDYSYPFVRFRKNILTGERRFRLPDGQVAVLPEEWFEKYADLFEYGVDEDEKITVRKMFGGVLNELLTGQGQAAAVEYNEKANVPVPSKIKATLRPYQQEGFNWLTHLKNNRFGGCLADDMGLGKTLQTITLLQHVYDPSSPEEKTRTVTPVADEFGQFSLFGDDGGTGEAGITNETSVVDCQPSLIVVPTSLVANWKKEITKFSTLRTYVYSGERSSKNACRTFDRFQVVLVTYGMLRRDIDLLETYPFNYVILDESQYIKNPESLTYESVMRLKNKHRLALTGTPIENSLKDLWAQFNFINPGLLGTVSFFRKQFIVPIMKNGDTRMRDKLRRLISPFILRRTKKQVAPELPPLTEEVVYCDMDPEQEAIYRMEKNRLRYSLLEEWGRNKLLALNGILKLRQLANHPKLLYEDYEGSSGKMDQIVEAYETLLSEGHKVLIFSSFVTHLELLAEEFRQRGWAYAMLSGATTDRQKEIARFTQNESVSAFLISLKAGGVGLNLTEADYVFIIDPWWNPAAEMQAESRAHRLGQGKQVFVYRFITDNTIEEKIRLLQEKKSVLADTFVFENDPLQNISDEEWRDLLRE